jgi:imidazoleglycerol-phosphate dehydratase/histidinol-phosphatase
MLGKIVFIEKKTLLLNNTPSPCSFVGLYNLSKQGFRLVLVSDEGSTENLVELFKSQKIEFLDTVEITKLSEFLLKRRVDLKKSFFVGSAPTFLESIEKIDGKSINASEFNFDFLIIAETIILEPRISSRSRKTNETDIQVEVNLDGKGQFDVSTGIEFFDHMLEQLSRHGGFDLRVKAVGDLGVDEHHTVEDVAICIGEAINDSLSEKVGIGRYGFVIPMDESLAKTAIDFSGRPYLGFRADFKRGMVGELPTEMVEHFFRSFTDAMRASLHIEAFGENDHHIIEAIFKSVGRSLRSAIRRTNDSELPTTKGVL